MNTAIAEYACFAVSAIATFIWLRLLDSPWGKTEIRETPGLLWILLAGRVYRRQARIILRSRPRR